MVKDLQSQMWRAAARGDIADAASDVAAVIMDQAPLGALALARVNARGHVEPAASVKGDLAELGFASPSAPAHVRRLTDWCRRGGSVHTTLAQCKKLPVGLALGWRDHQHDTLDLFAVGLTNAQGPIGLLVIVASLGRKFNAEQVQVLQAAVEPLAAALDADRRFRELASLREAAEAEKRSLLTRLGREQLGDVIIGQQGGLRLVMERVKLVARSDIPVLILGETGSGKEVVARHIHGDSDRARQPFMRINCGAIPPELVDSELFGHERGSFTGATGERQGWFERAHGGTLFLDEIGELPLAAQVRLLRVLQDGTFERVGGHKQLAVDVRIVAATHRDLPSMIGQGTFREDLWYRISTFPIRLPPLRERLEDIAALTDHFAQRAARRFGLPAITPSNADVALLRAYAWPGNVRELAAVVDRAVILGEGKSLEFAKALGFATGVGPAIASIDPPTGRSPGPMASPTVGAQIETLDRVITRHIETALAATGGRIEGRFGAARLLNINPHTLRARMLKLKIDWRRFRTGATKST